MFNRIILPLDGSEIAQCAMPYALALADAARAPLTLLQVVPRARAAMESALRYDAAEEAAALDRCGEALDAVAESLRTASRIVDVYVTVGDPAEEIIRYADRSGSDLIAMATHGKGGALRWAFGSVARKVLTGASVPTLIARSHDGPDAPARPAAIRSLFVPLDGSALAASVLPLVRDLASAVGARVTLARVLPPPWSEIGITGPAMGMTSVYPVYGDEAIAGMETAAHADLDAAVQGLKSAGIAASSAVRVGSAANTLLDLLDETAHDLVVAATHGRTGVARWVLGSVAERLIEGSRTPVLLVRAGEKAE
jgi:nucleotide-binding universal stress UspA family protein